MTHSHDLKPWLMMVIKSKYFEMRRDCYIFHFDNTECFITFIYSLKWQIITIYAVIKEKNGHYVFVSVKYFTSIKLTVILKYLVMFSNTDFSNN